MKYKQQDVCTSQRMLEIPDFECGRVDAED
jgi:hypothetical protein